MRHKPLLALLMLSSLAIAAEPSKPQKLLPLQRLTVGPNDNFQGTVDEAESTLYYTRSENLSSQIMRLDLKLGLTSAVTSNDADAKSPALSPDGKALAINYFKKDAKGDICLVAEKEVDCISKRGVADHSPVWIGNDRLAYLSSDDFGKISQLKIYDIGSKKTEELASGELYSPDLAPDGHTLVYKGKKNELVLYDIQSRKVSRSILVELPGITGPARFSADGKYLYIAQYMLDSNRDLVIDGRDASAIFRYELSTTTPLPPVQVTSLAQNCSYPYPAKNALYMTCAFEGALDVYRGPLDGSIPNEWNAQDLNEAHQVARSYFDRVLFLNQLHTRFKTLKEADFRERSFQNFLYAAEYLPASYYLEQQAAKGEKKERAEAYTILMNSFARWEVMPEKRNLGAFAQYISQQRQSLAKLAASPEKQIVQAYLEYFAGVGEKSLATLPAVQEEVAVFLSTNLHRLVFQKTKPERYRQYLSDKILTREGSSEENRLYFLSLWLNELPADKDPTAAVNELKPKVKGSMLELLDTEVDLYNLAKSTEEMAGRVHYKAIAARVKKMKDQYYAMRLLFNRSIVVFYRNKRSRNMADIVTLWLSLIKRESKELPFALDASRANSLDLAYQFMHAGEKSRNYAVGAFYDSIRSSDDLESHFQYSLLNFEKWDPLLENYKQMVAQGLLRSESLMFVETVKKVLHNPAKTTNDDLAEAAAKIAGIRDDHVGAGEKYLFLGYLYQKQITTKGFKVDRSLAEKAHRAYLFAIDAALSNDRIQAAALQNLGILHLTLRNASLAAEFLAKRGAIPYNNAEEQIAVLWLKAKALYLSYRLPEALAAMEEAIALKPSPLAPFQEKAAFYAWNAGQYPKALTHYEARLGQTPAPGANTLLGYGYALRKANKVPEALVQLKKVVAMSPADVKDADAPALFTQALKLRFIALGLIAQTQSAAAPDRKAALQERLGLFPKIIDSAKLLHFDKEALHSQRIKEEQDLAAIQLALGQKGEAEGSLKKSIEGTGAFAKEFGYLNNTTMTALKNAWIFAHENKLAATGWAAQAAEIQSGMDKEFAEQKSFTPLVTQKWAEFKLIAAAYSKGKGAFADQSKQVFDSAAVKAMEKEKPELYLSLGKYRDSVQKAL